MDSIFRASWDELIVEDVEAFLADATEEGLTWEAKREQPRPASLAKAAGGMANAIGGFVLLGAVRDQAGVWTLPGATFSADEPGTWVTSVLNARLRPVPDAEPNVFDREEGRKAVVVRVQPVAAPPCITSDGIVYLRVSGQTLPVTDQAVLADLLLRGRSAREGAEAAARAAASALYSAPPAFDGAQIGYALGAAPVGHVTDKAARLFSPGFVTALHDLAATLNLMPGYRHTPGTDVRQDSVVFAVGSPGVLGVNFLGAYWDGGVGCAHAAGGELPLHDILPHHIARAWRTAVAALREYGGSGEVHVALLLNRKLLSDGRLDGLAEVRRWTDLREPTDEELASVEREVRRAFGQVVLEPDGDS
jgi:hypothetical protein